MRWVSPLPAVTANTVDGAQPVTAGTVSGQQVLQNGVPVTEVNANFIPGMSGAPTVNSDGEVVGIVSQGFGTRGNNLPMRPRCEGFLLRMASTWRSHPRPRNRSLGFG